MPGASRGNVPSCGHTPLSPSGSRCLFSLPLKPDWLYDLLRSVVCVRVMLCDFQGLQRPYHFWFHPVGNQSQCKDVWARLLYNKDHEREKVYMKGNRGVPAHSHTKPQICERCCLGSPALVQPPYLLQEKGDIQPH